MSSVIAPLEPSRSRPIPGDSGPPGIGHSLEFAQDPLGFIQRRMARHGSVSWCSLFGRRMNVLLGPDANEWVLKTQGAALSNKGGWNVFLESLFDRGLMLRDGKDHRAQRKVMQVAFKPAALRGYVEEMNRISDERVAQWETGDDAFLLYPAIKSLTLGLASRVFLGMPLVDQSSEVNQAFIDTVHATLSLIRYPIPGGLYRKGIQGRAFLERYLTELLPEKRAQETPDMLSRLCHAISEDGEVYRDDDVIDHMIFLLMAAHDTTTSTLSALFYELAKHPEWQVRLREELWDGAAPGIDLTALEGARYSEMAAKETLRLYPPVPTQPRLATEDLSWQGYDIPAGSFVAISSLYTHRMPEHWPAPQSFDPLRFDNEGLRHKGHPYAWFPFGGGAHLCIGMHFALLEIKVVLHHVLSRYRVSVPENYEMPLEVVPLMQPRDGLTVRLEPL